MKYYITENNLIIAETSSKIAALDLIREYKEQGKYSSAPPEYSIIEGKPREFIK